jgi:hypothetical protein
MVPTFDIEGLPQLSARLDNIATLVSEPVAREALQAGGKIIKDRAWRIFIEKQAHLRTTS